MLSLPHLIVLFVIALVVFGPQKLPELARMLGKATAEFRKMSNDFRYALEDEVRELERQTRIHNEEIAAAAKAAETSPAPPEGTVPRESQATGAPGQTATEHTSHVDSGAAPTAPPQDASAQDAAPWDGQIRSTTTEQLPPADADPANREAVSAPQEKPSDDHTAV